MYRTDAPSDTVDFADIARTLRRQWRALGGFVALGVLGAMVVILFAPRRFEGRATVLVRPASAGSATSIVGRINGIGDLIGGLSGLSGSSAGFETELQVIRSRAIAGQVVDSFRLQFRVKDPEGTPPDALIASSALDGSFAPRKLRFERQPDGSYRVNWNGKAYDFRSGTPTAVDIGTLTLASGRLPASFVVTLMDREDAITRFASRLEATKAGGEVAKVVYRGDDSLTAAAAPNAVVSYYLQRRRTTDRGVNQRRVEYVTAQMDSTAVILAATERQLRQYQEASQVIDPEAVGRVELEGASTLRRALTDVQVDEGAIQQLLAQSGGGSGGRIASRDLAAYPGFLRSSSVAPLVNQLSELETLRIKLLERRTERDPEVITLDQTIGAVEANIIAMARSYAGALSRQRRELQARVDSAQRTLLALPAAAERGGRLKRDVIRLTQIFTALQAQLVEARLGAIAEGGDVRQVDVAVPPRRPVFPQPILTMGVGIGGGLLMGVVAAMMLSLFGRWLRDPLDIERALGVSAQRFLPDAPLMMVNAGGARTLLVVPLDARAQAGTVAARLARTARQRALPATFVDLTNGRAGNGAGGGSGVSIVSEAGSASEVVTALDHLERDNPMIIVQLPALTSDETISALRESRPVLLVAPPGPVDRIQLANALDTLRRLQVPCAGVVITDGVGRGHALT